MVLEAAEGMDLRELSVRALAARLRVSDTALHYHFGSRAALLAALAERATERFAFPARRGPWRNWLKRYCKNFRRVLRAHPGAADYLVASGPARGAQVRIIDRALGVLGDYGLTERKAWLVYVTAVNYVLAHAQGEDRIARQLDAGADMETRLRHETADDAAAARVARAIRRGQAADTDRLFRFGLSSLLRGMKV